MLNLFKRSKKFLLNFNRTFYSFQVKAASKYVEVPVSIKNSLIFLPNLCKSILCKTNFFSFRLPQKPGMDVADGYVTFVRHSQDILRDKVNEEVYIERLFDVSKMP